MLIHKGRILKVLTIKILGSGCPNCRRLEKVARAAAGDAGIEAAFEKVTDINDILAYPIASTPALVINGKVVSSGRVPNKPEITSMITTALMEAET